MLKIKLLIFFMAMEVKPITEAKVKTKKQTAAAKQPFDAVAEAKETATTTLKLIISSLTLVAGLAWNQVIKKFAEVYIASWFKDFGELVGLLIYAIVLTVVTVLVIGRLRVVDSRIKAKKEEK
ncbi:hypothetical protein JW796_02570 [Candidatus Dojkabacteria bacterium]|nr:hypothetical protein [Candidatus Dojkabacteria bacterium]